MIHYLLDGNTQFTELYSTAPVVGVSVKPEVNWITIVAMAIFNEQNTFL